MKAFVVDRYSANTWWKAHLYLRPT